MVKRWTQEENDEVYAAFLRGDEYKAIAARFGVSKGSITSKLRQWGLKRRLRTKDQTREIAREMLGRGMTKRQIAEELGLCAKYIRTITQGMK